MVNERERAELWESFADLLDRLRAEGETPGTVIAVEGTRDRAALRRLGLGPAVMLVHRGRSMSRWVHELGPSTRRVVVLTDWDRAGGELAARLRDHLRASHVDCDLELRRRLAVLLHGELVHVEGLFGWARRMAESLGRPLEDAVARGPSGPARRPTG